MDEDRRIAAVDEVPADGSLLFRVRDDEHGVREAILVRAGREGGGGEEPSSADGAPVTAWLNSCRHFTHVRLDTGSGATRRNGEVVCTNHGAMFAVDSGECTHGPCEGAFLASVDVAVRDGAVYLADGAYDLVGRGPIERDPADLTATSNVEF